MKKMISLLSVAVLAVVFAAGCGKHTECKQATTKTECNDAKKFEEGKHNCEWKPKTPGTDDETKGECKDKPASAAWSVTTEATAECAKVATPADQAACTAKDADANDVAAQKALNAAHAGKTVVCNFVNATTACKAEQKP